MSTYIYNIPHFNSKFLSIDVENVVLFLIFFISIVVIVLKTILNFDFNSEKKEEEEEEQTKPAAIKIRVTQIE